MEIEVINMPKDNSHPYALHIHEGNSCGNNDFESAKGHYNTKNQPHPMHAGDLPPLFSNDGYSYMRLYTNKFTPEQVIGRTVIIHNGADDFKTQPSGNSGAKMACGVIVNSNNNRFYN
ncbi:Superoxide dismutase-like protein YojM [bioreactor metagenome]|uniref:Superoxide dismutase-like protein YojM n=1 Tax=bioreactor metagenome TaxID=1076179 RepID=A0A645I109_9ZZZZ